MAHAVKVPQRRAARLPEAGARQLEFEALTIPAPPQLRSRPPLRLALGGARRGPEKYRLLEHRRRQAQIKARRLLAMAEHSEAGVPGIAGSLQSGEDHEEPR